MKKKNKKTGPVEISFFIDRSLHAVLGKESDALGLWKSKYYTKILEREAEYLKRNTKAK